MHWIALFLLTAIPLPPTWPGEPYSLPAEMDPTLADGSSIEPEYWNIFEEDDEDDEHDADHEKEADGPVEDDEGSTAVVPKVAVLTGTACIRDLVRRGIDVKAAPGKRGVETPVHVFGKIGGVEWYYAWDPKGAMNIDCKFVYSLLRFAPILAANNVKRVTYTSTYRPAEGRRIISQHGHGLAVDVRSVTLNDGRELVVLRDWRKAYGTKDNCVGKPSTPEAKILRTIICQAEKADIFRLMLTPDSDWSHQNHFHIDGLGRIDWMRPRHGGRLADQPLPGEPAFENWWKWYVCYKKRTPRARERCWNNRAYLKPRNVDTTRTLSPSVQKPREPKRRAPSRRKSRR
ncbi:MAG: hypothetical protein CVU65_18275 [Deltaproteobacteria bacterium HGW-Deltaproteobacteria-22]|jgi:hypothetical protein|nr:MAG: hypothetical protein CVU65_18275 [Deltaproteobacteria bacterium HGW-Deltaproteobacteria-22]